MQEKGELYLNPKPYVNCGGCELYGEQCHCLCHKKDLFVGYHEIMYENGPAPVIIEYPGER